MDFNREWFGLRCRELAILSVGAFAGSAWYINIVEHPARMTADMTTAVKIWKPSFIRAASLQSKTAVVATLSSVAAYGFLKGTSKENILWLVSAAGILSVLPFTIAFIRPINNQLLDTEQCLKQGPDWIEEKLNAWNFRHAFRTGCSLLSFGIMIYILSE